MSLCRLSTTYDDEADAAESFISKIATVKHLWML